MALYSRNSGLDGTDKIIYWFTRTDYDILMKKPVMRFMATNML